MSSSAPAVDSVVSAGVVRRQLKAAVEGEAPWSVRLGHGTSVFFDFGDRVRSEVDGTPDRGSDQLWVYSSSWRLFGSPSGDDESTMEAATTSRPWRRRCGSASAEPLSVFVSTPA